jgi:hypothetical protein
MISLLLPIDLVVHTDSTAPRLELTTRLGGDVRYRLSELVVAPVAQVVSDFATPVIVGTVGELTHSATWRAIRAS